MIRLKHNEMSSWPGAIYVSVISFHDIVVPLKCSAPNYKERIFKDLTPLIVPYAETLAMFGAKHLDIVVESFNEGCNNCIRVTKPRPQPDYAVGFGRSVFSDDQLSKLQPFTGDPSYSSYFLATCTSFF